jgi:uncharacterized glyoxalase superfamily protein PhnB
MTTDTEPTVSLSLTVRDANAALDFYARALGAKELFRLPAPDGSVAHAEFMVGNTHIYISDEAPEWHAKAMPDDGMAACLFTIMTDNCDDAYRRALDAGAHSLGEPTDQFWGMRSAMVKDPYGYRWSFAQRTENLSSEEIMARAQEFFGG